MNNGEYLRTMEQIKNDAQGLEGEQKQTYVERSVNETDMSETQKAQAIWYILNS